MKQQTSVGVSAKPGVLAHVVFEGVDYTVDLRLGEFRDSQQPWVNIGFDSEQGQRMCRLLNVVRSSK